MQFLNNKFFYKYIITQDRFKKKDGKTMKNVQGIFGGFTRMFTGNASKNALSGSVFIKNGGSAVLNSNLQDMQNSIFTKNGSTNNLNTNDYLVGMIVNGKLLSREETLEYLKKTIHGASTDTDNSIEPSNVDEPENSDDRVEDNEPNNNSSDMDSNKVNEILDNAVRNLSGPLDGEQLDFIRQSAKSIETDGDCEVIKVSASVCMDGCCYFREATIKIDANGNQSIDISNGQGGDEVTYYADGSYETTSYSNPVGDEEYASSYTRVYDSEGNNTSLKEVRHDGKYSIDEFDPVTGECTSTKYYDENGNEISEYDFYGHEIPYGQ